MHPIPGAVYKLVSINDKARLILRTEMSKVVIPGTKEAYRLFNSKWVSALNVCSDACVLQDKIIFYSLVLCRGEPVVDLLTAVGTSAPAPRRRILCRHPFDANKRVYVTPVSSVHT